jgi:hypothetical protein
MFFSFNMQIVILTLKNGLLMNYLFAKIGPPYLVTTH